MKKIHLDTSLEGVTRNALQRVLGELLDGIQFSFTDNVTEANVVVLTSNMRLEEIHDFDRSFVLLTLPGQGGAPESVASNVCATGITTVVTVVSRICATAVDLPVRPKLPTGGLSVLIVDDTQVNVESAWKQLGGKYRLQVVTTYLQALRVIREGEFDILLTDLMLPASVKTMGQEGLKHVGELMPLGLVLALLAEDKEIPKVAVVTDMNHHAHPFAAALLDDLRGVETPVSEISFVNSGGGTEGKDWQSVIDALGS